MRKYYLILLAITCLFASCSISEDIVMTSKKRATYSFKAKIQKEFVSMMNMDTDDEGFTMFSKNMAALSKAYQNKELEPLTTKYGIADPYVLFDMEKGIFEYSFSFDWKPSTYPDQLKHYKNLYDTVKVETPEKVSLEYVYDPLNTGIQLFGEGPNGLREESANVDFESLYHNDYETPLLDFSALSSNSILQSSILDGNGNNNIPLGIINPYFIIDTKSKSLYKENTFLLSQMLFPELFEDSENDSEMSNEQMIDGLKVLGAEFDYIFSFTSYRNKVKCEHPNALIEEKGKKIVVKWSFDELIERKDSMKLVISY